MIQQFKGTRQLGFTLLEVMVVLAIMGLMLGIATLSTGGNDRKQEAQQEAFRFIAQLDAYRNEAVFQNIDLGLAMDGQSTQLLVFVDINNQSQMSGKKVEELSALKDNPWVAYQGSLNSTYELPEYLSMTIEIEGKEIDLNELIDSDAGVKPAILFLSSDEYTSFNVVIRSLYDESFSIFIKGDGFSRFMMTTEQYEF